MIKTVWKNRSNGQLCVTIPTSSDIREGDLIELKKASIKRIAYSGVVADLFHYGHLQSIQYAKSISDYNVVGVITDKAVEEYRTKPVANLKERKAIISSLNCVDKVMVEDSRDPTENLKKLHKEFPDAEIILVHGSDLSYVHGSDYVRSINGKIVQHPYYERLSTYKIISTLLANKDKFKDIVHLDSIIKGKTKIDFEYKKGNKIVISSKADTLAALSPLLKKARIEKMLVFSISDWKNKKDELLKKIREEFNSKKIAVRSSAVNEDTLDSSMAGYFDTVLDVDSSNVKDVENAVKKVIGSYKSKMSENSFNQILVQKQSEDIVMSGVVFTRSLEKNSPYYIINYDTSGKTDGVTKGIENKTIKVSKFAETKNMPEKMQNLLSAIKEIENIIPDMALDIEFAINSRKEAIIFQVRPLITASRNEADDEEVKTKLMLVKKEFENFSKRNAHLSGDRAIAADMPDWNPAEIIGDNPNYLDYSLYDYIITDSAWHEARTSQGYFNVNPAKLVVLFGNKPYVDARASFNSFTPASLSQKIREKLVNFYLSKLEKNPEMQDKVEFEIAYTCYDLGFDERAKELEGAGFLEEEVSELKQSLISLTNNLVINSKEAILEDLRYIKEMESSRGKAGENTVPGSVKLLLKNAKFLLDDCRKNGTVQFSRLARLGFIGKIILKSLVKNKIINNEFYDLFMNSVSTVAKEMSNDFKLLTAGKMANEEFIKKYYHLRPGSYDITSSRYGSNPELLKSVSMESAESTDKKFELDKEKEEKISKALKEHGLKFNAKQLLEFIKSSLEARELSKFEFSKNLSDALEYTALAGEEMGFTRQELALLGADDLLTKGDREELTKKWKERIMERKKEREINNLLLLPPIIFSTTDFDVVTYYVPRPNYITNKRVEAELINMSKFDKDNIPEIKNKVVLIENGDPGYDWIFTRNIAGLITKYGGVASHMSIRCAEFGIPAAIGCGVLFDSITNANSVVLDCKFKKIEAVRGAL